MELAGFIHFLIFDYGIHESRRVVKSERPPFKGGRFCGAGGI